MPRPFLTPVKRQRFAPNCFYSIGNLRQQTQETFLEYVPPGKVNLGLTLGVSERVHLSSVVTDTLNGIIFSDTVYINVFVDFEFNYRGGCTRALDEKFVDVLYLSRDN